MAAKKETGEKLVPVQLFKDGGKYRDDVFVAVNGRSYQIQRGEMVYVPESVAEVLSQSMAQDNATAQMIERESSDFVKQAKSLRI